MKIQIPGIGEKEWNKMGIDLNGTATQFGAIEPGTKDLLDALQGDFSERLLLTGDTRGTGARVAQELQLELITTPDGTSKAEALRIRKPGQFVVFGNGDIDIPMFELARESGGLVIAIDGDEGMTPGTFALSHIKFRSLRLALRALLEPQVIIAGLRR